ncbi:MAG: restriction endonuclease subunit S, partial [Vampirovibrionales bacterium]
PYIVQSMFNNMLSRKVNKQWLIDHNEAPVSGNRIVLGVTLPAVSYQPSEFGASQVITAKAEWLNKQNGIFVATAISKLMYQFSYGRKPGVQIYKEMKIQLPSIRQNGEAQIAFDFMEEFVATLKAERLATLKAYLTFTGLTDTTLTASEETALARLNSLTWKAFRILDLFGKSSRGRRLKSADRIEGKLPFVTAGEANAGISAWIGNDVHIFSKNTVTIDMFGSAKYRGYDYGADDHVAVVHSEKWLPYAVLFLTACIHKSSHAGQFDYSRNFYASDADDLTIQLPITKEGTPDYDTMSLVVSALQKVVIQGVVSYLDDRIEKTGELV